MKKLGDWPVLVNGYWNDTNFNWMNMEYELKEMGFIPNHFFELKIVPYPGNSEKRIIFVSTFDLRNIISLENNLTIKFKNNFMIFIVGQTRIWYPV